LFQVAFNFRCLNRVQLAIDVGMNNFQYFLTTQLGTSTGFALKLANAVTTTVGAAHRGRTF
jgi:hypothetical protein